MHTIVTKIQYNKTIKVLGRLTTRPYVHATITYSWMKDDEVMPILT